MDLVRLHFYGGECCKVNSATSNFLLLDAALFHNYLLETGRLGLDAKQISLPSLMHLHSLPAYRNQLEERYPKFSYFRVYL